MLARANAEERCQLPLWPRRAGRAAQFCRSTPFMNTRKRWSRILPTFGKSGMKAFAPASSAGGPHHEIQIVASACIWSMVVASLFLGMTALLVSFVAGSAFETSGTTSFREIIAACVAAALYLAFCQFWVAPRGRSGFWIEIAHRGRLRCPVAGGRGHLGRRGLEGIPWLASGCLGSVIGAMIAQRVTATPQAGDSDGRFQQSRQKLSQVPFGGFHTIGRYRLRDSHRRDSIGFGRHRPPLLAPGEW